MTALVRRLRGGEAEAGFTVVEVIVALVLLAMGMSSLGALYTTSLGIVRVAKERQAATGLAGQAMEQLRALPYATATGGQRTADLTAPDVTTSGGSYWLTLVSPQEEVVTNAAGSLPAPLQPAAPVTLDQVTYTVRAYVTKATALGANVFRATVVVRWTSSLSSNKPRSFTTSSMLSSPSGCVSSATHPFAAPCQPFFYTSAGTGAAAVDVVPLPLSGGDVGPDDQPIDGLRLTSARLALAKVVAGGQAEQVTTLSGAVSGSSGTVTSTDVVSATAPGSGSIAVDNDPSGSAPASDTATSSQSAQSAGLSGSTGSSLVVVPGGTDSGSTAAAVTASGSPACTSVSAGTVAPGQLCSSGSVTQSGTARVAAALTGSGASLGTVDLVTAGAPAEASQVFGARTLASASWCSTSDATVGCAAAEGRRTFGALTLAPLPATLLAHGRQPPGWTSAANAYISVDAVRETVAVQSGPGSAVPATPTRVRPAGGTPVVTWYDSSTGSYRTRALTTPGALTIPDVTATDPGYNGGTLTVTMSAALSVGGLAATSSAASCTVECQRTANAYSPVSGTVTYKVTFNGVVVARLQLIVGYGALTASTSYKAAPSAG